MRRVHVWVEGIVQGVFFRARCSEQARLLKLGGWVRNLRDGRVEAVFEGTSAAVDRMIEWCRKGPPSARVDRLETVDEEPIGEAGFRVTA